ncbi:MAG TPA: LiaF domain-containing protein [Steroidobacteraceae bacterium]|nr:LiaF domain-containing protein [Steroidobacteraceae bacterium]
MYNTQPTNPEDARSRAIGVALIGVLIIAAGAVLLGGNLGLIDAHFVFRNFGPLIIFLVGAALLARRRHDQVLLGLVLMFVGAWGFATQQQWIKIHFWAVIGPLLLVLAGGSVVWRAFNRPAPEGAGDSYIRTFSVFSGAELRPTVPFQGADLTAVMGGAKLDLSNTTMAQDTAVIDVFALMGGAEILVPRDWDVTVRVVSLMGGGSDKRRPATAPATKHLVIQGMAVMGGVEIKD